MTRIVLTVLFLALVAGVAAPSAAAKQLHSTVASWSPNDVQPGDPVSVVLVLYSGGPTPYPKDGKPVAGVNDVEVVIRGSRESRRFAAQDLGGGRYGTHIVFPNSGGWDLRVSYGAGDYGAGDEILLGKGGICVGGELCAGRGAQPSKDLPARGENRRLATVALRAAIVLVALVMAALIAFAAFGRRRRLAHSA